METRKLYYEDPHLRSFRSRVLTCEAAKGGYLVTLDATAFYPEGGGQACDLGHLGEAAVLDVQEKDDVIFHLCDKPLPVDEIAEGVIDWEDFGRALAEIDCECPVSIETCVSGKVPAEQRDAAERELADIAKKIAGQA